MKLAPLLIMLTACAAAPTKAQQEDVAKYQAEQLACVATHDTKASVDACRESVMVKFGRSDAGITDAGADHE